MSNPKSGDPLPSTSISSNEVLVKFVTVTEEPSMNNEFAYLSELTSGLSFLQLVLTSRIEEMIMNRWNLMASFLLLTKIEHYGLVKSQRY